MFSMCKTEVKNITYTSFFTVEDKKKKTLWLREHFYKEENYYR